MKRKDQESDTRPFEETAENSPVPSSATGLFSRSCMAAASPIEDRDEISQLLREPQDVADTQPIEEKSPSPPSSPSTASQSVDLTGIFRKVKFDRALDGSRRIENRVSPAASPGASESEQGFTQMFQSLSAASGKTTPGVESSVAGPEKAKQETINAESEEKLPPLKWKEGSLPGNEASRQLRQGSQSLGRGEFTRLFQRLDRNETASADAGTGERPNVSQTTPEFGGFTQLLRTLSAEAEAVETPLQSAIAAPVVSQSSSGPGEFTRIISGSMLREAQGRTGISQSANGDAWQQQQTPMAASGSTPMPMPNLTPGMSPVMPAAASPVMPMTPQMVSPPPPRIPMTPPVPSAPAPSLHVQPVVPAGGKLQQYMPLLLIANFFLMLLVLILVVFVLLHHH